MASVEITQYLWVFVVLFAALAQTVRNTAQRSLTNQVGTLAATLVRFLYGLPFALIYLLMLYASRNGLDAGKWTLPQFSGTWLAWIVLGAVFQFAATAALLLAMKERNFAIAVTLSKTEVLQIAVFAAVFLHEVPTVAALGAMLLATAGVLLLSLPPGKQLFSPSAWVSKSSLYGLLCGACFAVAAIGFRGAAVELARLGEASPWMSGAWGVFVSQCLTTVLLGGYMAYANPAGMIAIIRSWRVSLLAGLMGAAASLAWFTAYAMQDAATVRTLAMIEVLFSYLVSRRIFQESLTRAEMLGMGLVLIGAILICLQI